MSAEDLAISGQASRRLALLVHRTNYGSDILCKVGFLVYLYIFVSLVHTQTSYRMLYGTAILSSICEPNVLGSHDVTAFCDTLSCLLLTSYNQVHTVGCSLPA